MTSQLYNLTTSAYVNGLTALTDILKKAESHAAEKGIPLDDLINARLYEDMKPLTFQVQVASSTALKAAARATQTEPLDLPLTETTFDELHARISKALEVVKAVDPAVFASHENTTFKAPLGTVEREFTLETYNSKFGLPNFFFHVTTAYAILRAKGVPLGKMDYLSPFVKSDGL